jgi:3-methyl-2-oxobutanoate hydroxymethyltransferase
MEQRPINLTDFITMKKDHIPITVLTAYDTVFAQLLDQAGVDMILVGDSLGNVVQGHETTIPVTLEQMIYHAEIVARTVKRAFVAVDMPFLTYQVTDDEAVRNAGRLIQETGCRAVKLEGGLHRITTIRRIVETGIPVIGHVGLTPQSVNIFGGYRVQGRNNPQTIIDDARAVEQSGAFMVVLEGLPRNLAEKITTTLSIPTIGIGAGTACDGQVLVTYDLLGLFKTYTPKFVRRYVELADAISEAVSGYCRDVRERKFPGDQESYE